MKNVESNIDFGYIVEYKASHRLLGAQPQN
jgi:hypothetical protein